MSKPRPLPKRRLIVGGILMVAAIALSFVSNLVLGLSAMFIPVILAVMIVVMGLTRKWAPWPWIVGIGFGILPASYMAFVRFCDNLGGVCPTGDELHHEKQAVYSLILFALALAAMLIKRSPARDALVATLTLLGEIWLIVKLRGIDEVSGQLVVFALIIAGITYEIVTRVRTEQSSQPAT